MPGSEGQIPYTFSLSVARRDEKAPSHVFVCDIKTDQKRTDGEERGRMERKGRKREAWNALRVPSARV